MGLTWEQFVSRHAQAVMSSALRVISNVSDAEDVAQDVFLEILRNGRMQELSRQPALLRVMATRRALDLIRKKRAHLLDELEPDPRVHEPIQHSIAAELEERLQIELARLSPRQAEVFCLTYFEDLSGNGIAAILGISPGAVAKALSEARKRLSTAFAKLRTGSMP